jgi:RNA polymerase sigma-70 factor (ECF subfamily)
LFVERVMDVNHAVVGDRDAVAVRRAGFAALYNDHVAEVYRFVHRRCRDRAIAEDVTQDTFLTAVRTVQDPTEVTVGWLIEVARNRLVDIIRRRARYVDKLRLIGPDDVDLDGSAAVADRIRVHDALDRLRVEHRVVLSLHYIDEMTTEAIATELGRSHKSVEGLITRARRTLRRELENRDD